jgi:hypothetical protein
LGVDFLEVFSFGTTPIYFMNSNNYAWKALLLPSFLLDILLELSVCYSGKPDVYKGDIP